MRQGQETQQRQLKTERDDTCSRNGKQTRQASSQKSHQEANHQKTNLKPSNQGNPKEKREGQNRENKQKNQINRHTKSHKVRNRYPKKPGHILYILNLVLLLLAYIKHLLVVQVPVPCPWGMIKMPKLCQKPAKKLNWNKKKYNLDRQTQNHETEQTKKDGKNTIESNIRTTTQKLRLKKNGDIEPNPGPIYNATKNLPRPCRERQNKYFQANTLSFKGTYKHLAKTFMPYLDKSHPKRRDAENTPLRKHCDLLNDYPYQYHIFALIITIGPTPQICNQYLNKQTNLRSLDILRKLQKMPLDKTNAEQLDTLDTFFKNNQDLLNNQNPVQNQLYPYITNPNNQINDESLKGKFPFLPQELIKEILKRLEPIEGYQHKDKEKTPTQTTTPRSDKFRHHETYMITWNVASLNTALPGITDLIQHTNQPTIIMIQETKFSEQKSTKYLNKLFPNYALTFNNMHAKTTCNRRPYIPYKPHKGGLLTMIHKNYNFPRNIKKIPSPPDISPYLQIISIGNKPLKIIILINLYMPSHPEDI
jgi:hypothetical protein